MILIDWGHRKSFFDSDHKIDWNDRDQLIGILILIDWDHRKRLIDWDHDSD